MARSTEDRQQSLEARERPGRPLPQRRQREHGARRVLSLGVQPPELGEELVLSHQVRGNRLQQLPQPIDFCPGSAPRSRQPSPPGTPQPAGLCAMRHFPPTAAGGISDVLGLLDSA